MGHTNLEGEELSRISVAATGFNLLAGGSFAKSTSARIRGRGVQFDVESVQPARPVSSADDGRSERSSFEAGGTAMPTPPIRFFLELRRVGEKASGDAVREPQPRRP